MEKLQLDRDAYLKILKIQDLQQFGNSILELMVGKYQESNVMEEKITTTEGDPSKSKPSTKPPTVNNSIDVGKLSPEHISVMD